MPQDVERNLEIRRRGMVEIRFRIPLFVAEWLAEKAQESFKPRNNYIKDTLISWYRREHGRS
jgi:hypothetical protein